MPNIRKSCTRVLNLMLNVKVLTDGLTRGYLTVTPLPYNKKAQRIKAVLGIFCDWVLN